MNKKGKTGLKSALDNLKIEIENSKNLEEIGLGILRLENEEEEEVEKETKKIDSKDTVITELGKFLSSSVYKKDDTREEKERGVSTIEDKLGVIINEMTEEDIIKEKETSEILEKVFQDVNDEHAIVIYRDNDTKDLRVTTVDWNSNLRYLGSIEEVEQVLEKMFENGEDISLALPKEINEEQYAKLKRDRVRDFRNLITDSNSDMNALKGLMDTGQMLDFLPTKILVLGSVYRFKVNNQNTHIEVSLANQFDKYVKAKNDGRVIREPYIEELLAPDEPFMFYPEDTAYAIKEILEVLIDINAIEVLPNGKPNGNIAFHEAYEEIEKMIIIEMD